MKNETKLSKISNLYNLKSIFYYLKPEKTLKIIKNNKHLQKTLGINLENYKILFNFPKYEFSSKIETIDKRTGPFSPGFKEGMRIIMLSCLTCIYFLYVLIYTILLNALDTFDDGNTKNNYNKDNYDKIEKINKWLIAFVFIIIASFISLIIFFKKNIKLEYGSKKIIKSFMILIIDLVYIAFEGIIIWKLALSYKIKSKDKKITWFMVLDYIFIIINFLYFLILLEFSCIFFCSSPTYSNEKNCLLTSFNYIEVNDYHLPDNFDKLEKKERKKYILNNYNNFEYKFSKNQYDLIKTINKIREDNNLQKFKIGKKIPEIIVKESTEIIINKEKHLIELSGNKYLFKYPVGEFENRLNNNDMNIFNILLNKNLNHIQITTKNNIEYIIFSELELFDYDSYELDSLNEIMDGFNYKANKGSYKLIDYEYKNYSE